MPLYYYQSIDSLGKKASHALEALSELEAKEKLRKQGIIFISLTSKPLEKNFSFFKKKKKVVLKGDELVTFSTQLSEILKASLPLYESLLSLEEQYRGEKVHSLILTLCERIKEGSSLSQAMSEFPDSFNTDYRAMVEAGESIGALDLALEKLALLLGKQRKLKKQIQTALLYPAILCSFSFFTILLLLTFVIPSMEVLFEGRAVNPFTSLVIGISHFCTRYWMFYLPFLFLLPPLFLYLKKRPQIQLWTHRFLLKLPFIKKLLVETSLARFTRTLGSLLEGGVSMVAALQCARKVMNHPILEGVVEEAEKRIIEGSLLSIELKKSKFIPLLVPRLLAIGEEGGKTQEMLKKLADLFEEEVEKKLARFLALLQPGILLLMGAIVGVIMLAVLLPLTDINSFLTGG